MTIIKEVQQPVRYVVPPLPEDYFEINRLLAAAVVNPQFCRLLLEDPELAIQGGYEGEIFLFSDVEPSIIPSIHANSLADLAHQLICTLGELSQIQCLYPAQLSEIIES